MYQLQVAFQFIAERAKIWWKIFTTWLIGEIAEDIVERKFFSKEDLNALTREELKTLCKDFGIIVPSNARKAVFIQAILDWQG